MGNKQLLVADVMTYDPIVVTVNASLEEADHLLRSTFITGLPVVDDGGTLVGVISHAHLAAYRFAVQGPEPNEAVAARRGRASEHAGGDGPHDALAR